MTNSYSNKSLFGDKPRGRCKKSWSPQEDSILQKLVYVHGTSSWTKIAEGLTTRTGKQCRERYHNHLQPNIRKGDWTEEEDRTIVEMQSKLGNQWAKITKMLPGRTDNAVKNRWHAAMRSQGRPSYGSGSAAEQQTARGERAERSGKRVSREGRPLVPTLPLDGIYAPSRSARGSGRKSSSSSSSSSSARGYRHHQNKDSSMDYLFLDTESNGKLSQRGHHTTNDHSLSSRTDCTSARTDAESGSSENDMEDDEDIININGPIPYAPGSAFSPRLMDFLNFPLSSSTSSTSALLSGEDSSGVSGPMLAQVGSPRDVCHWLSGSPRGVNGSPRDAFLRQCSYIASPGRPPYTTYTTVSRTNPTTTTTTSSSSTTSSQSASLMATEGAAFAALRSSFTKENSLSSDLGSTSGSSASSCSSSSSSSSSSSNSSILDEELDLPSGSGNNDRVEREVYLTLDLEIEMDDALTKLEISPRWELSPRMTPRSTRENGQFKRARFHTRTPTLSEIDREAESMMSMSSSMAAWT